MGTRFIKRVSGNLWHDGFVVLVITQPLYLVKNHFYFIKPRKRYGGAQYAQVIELCEGGCRCNLWNDGSWLSGIRTVDYRDIIGEV